MFNRVLSGFTDKLLNYKLEKLALTDERGVIHNYPVAVYTGNSDDQISGSVFQLSKDELLKADFYETAAYKRVKVRLFSGKTAWVYLAR